LFCLGMYWLHEGEETAGNKVYFRLLIKYKAGRPRELSGVMDDLQYKF